MEYKQIIADLKNQIYHPVYLLMGHEPYYIDQIADYISQNVLKTEEEREFNMAVLYGRDTDEETIISYAKSYSMMANYQLVIVKEAQNLKKIEKLQAYVENPLKSTILVLCYKYGTVDGRKSFAKTVKKNGVLFESKVVYDDKMPDWVSNFVKTKGFAIKPDAAALLAENIGNNLSRMANEVNKLTIVLPQGATITMDEIEKNIGISKDYNVFELQNALCERDILKANKIIDYFSHNPREHPLVMVLPVLYSFFSKILIYQSLKNKNDRRAVIAALGVNPFFLNRYINGAKFFPLKKLPSIFSYLREADEKAKGIGMPTKNDGGILKELIFKIMH